jgi:hypothetical protein
MARSVYKKILPTIDFPVMMQTLQESAKIFKTSKQLPVFSIALPRRHIDLVLSLYIED